MYSTFWHTLDEDPDSAKTNTINPKNALDFIIIMFVSIILGSVASLGYYLLVKFPVLDDEIPESINSSNTENQQQNSPIRFVRQLSEQLVARANWFKEYQLYQVALIYVSTRLFVTMSQIYMPFYLQVLSTYLHM